MNFPNIEFSQSVPQSIVTYRSDLSLEAKSAATNRGLITPRVESRIISTYI